MENWQKKRSAPSMIDCVVAMTIGLVLTLAWAAGQERQEYRLQHDNQPAKERAL